MEGLLHDGLTSRPWRVAVSLEGGRVVARAIEDPTVAVDWPLAAVREVRRADGRYLLSHGDDDARLILEAEAWTALSGRSADAIARRERRLEWRLIGGLAAVGLGLAAVVFIGVPIAAKPLADWTPPKLEARFGANMEAQLKVGFRPCQGDPRGAAVLSTLGTDLASGAQARFPIRVQAVRAPFVNA